MHRLNLNHLYIFYVVAREGSIRKVAKLVHKTQPTISEQIKALEFQLGKNLFERKANRLHLTEQGIQIYEHCSKMFKGGEQLIFNVNHEIKGQQKISIGIIPDIPKHIVFQLLFPVINDPKFFISTLEESHVSLKRKLLHDQIDIIIADAESKNLEPIIKQQEIFEREFAAVCHSSLKYPKSKFPRMLENIPYISYSKESDLYYSIENFFCKNKINPAKLCEIADIHLIKLLIETKLGFSIMPMSSVIDRINQKQFSILGKIFDIRSNVVLQFKDLERNKAVLDGIFKHINNKKHRLITTDKC